MTREYHIRAAGQTSDVQAVAKAEGENQTSQYHFRPSVLAADGGHVSAALFRGKYVRHASASVCLTD